MQKNLNFKLKKFNSNKKIKTKIVKVVILMMVAVMLSSCDKKSLLFGDKSSKNDVKSENSLLIQNQNPVDSPEWLKKIDGIENMNQIIVVAGVEGSTAYVSMHEKNSDGKWQMILETPGYIGHEGMGNADVNHAITPIGTYTIDKAFGLADNPGCGMEYTKITNDHYWSGDPSEGMHYNELVNVKDVSGIDVNNCEHISDYKYQYRYCLNMGYNSEKDPNKGFGFFMHCTGLQKPYTGGCVAVNEAVMKVIMQKVKSGCKIALHRADKLGIDLEEMQKYTNEKGV